MKYKLEKVLQSLKGESKPASKAINRVQLIKGSFFPAEAADILLSFINDKIKFHTVKKLNTGSEKDLDVLQSGTRIKELREAKERITHLVLEAHKKGQSLEIESSIEISLKNR